MSEWLDFIKQSTFASEVEVGLAETAKCALTDWRVLAFRGADAVAFLQGQSTNDVKQVSDNQFQLNGLCTAKGRMLATFWLARRGDDLLMILPSELREGIAQHLRKYVFRSAVTLDALDWGVLGLTGDGAEAMIQEAHGGVPDNALVGEELNVLRMPFPQPAFLLCGPAEALTKRWQAWEAAKGLPASRWNLLHILAGIPKIQTETRESFTPQMVNFPQAGGVSFQKGCYTGQEVVARTHYLGKAKRQLYPAKLDAPPPAVGTQVSGDAGEVILSAPWPGGGSAVLAVLQNDAVEAGGLRVNDVPLEMLDLPYPLETA